MAANFWKSSHYSQWLLDKQALSLVRMKDLKQYDLTEKDYLKILQVYTNFIQAIGEALKLRQQVISTAIVFLRRFYAKFSLKCIDPLLLSPTAIFLASKVEEYGVISNIRLLNVCQSLIKSPKFSSILNTSEYSYQVKNILECEFYLIEVLDCCLIVYHPYRALKQFVTDAVGTDDATLLNYAWKFVNDSMKTDVPLLYPPYLIAIAAVITAALLDKVDIQAWVMELNFDMNKVLEITTTVLDIHKPDEYDTEKLREILSKVPKPTIETTQPVSHPS